MRIQQFIKEELHGWKDGFNPYWVYEKYGFHKTEQRDQLTVVMTNAQC